MNSSDHRSDEELIDAMRHGETRAFEVLYRRHRDWVLRLARRFTGHHDDALDVLQETFAYVVKKVPTLDLGARFTTFLYPVVRHCSVDARRRANRFAGETHAAESIPANEEPDRSGGDLERMIESLPDGQREVVLLRFVDDLSLPEIAELLEIPLGTVKSRLHHALAHLRQDPATRRYFEN